MTTAVDKQRNYQRSHSDIPRIHIQNATFKVGDKKSMPPKQNSLCLEKLIESAEFLLQCKLQAGRFVETKAFTEGVRQLKRHLSVGIIGAPYSGRTTLMLNFVKKAMEFNKDIKLQPVNISKSEHLDLVPKRLEKGEGYILIIENIFGFYALGKDSIEGWVQQLDMIKNMLRLGQTYIVFTSDTIIYNQCQCEYLNRLGSDNLFNEDHCIFLHKDKFQLTDGQRKAILKKRDIPLAETSTDELSKFGFLWCCKKWTESPKANLLEQFRNPYDFIHLLIRSLETHDKDSYLMLVYILLMGGKLTTKRNGNNELKEKKIKEKMPSLAKIAHNLKFCKYLVGTFLAFNESEVSEGYYYFAEPCIRDIVLLQAFTSESDTLLQLCPLEFLLDRVHTTDEPHPEHCLKFDAHVKASLAERLKVMYHTEKSNIVKYEALFKGGLLDIMLSYYKNEEMTRSICEALFMHISSSGDKQAFETILSYIGKDVIKKKRSDGETVPMVFVIKSNIDSFDKLCLLVDGDCLVENLCVKGRHILHYVAEHWEGTRVRQLFDKYRAIDKLMDIKDRDGRTPIHVAAMSGKCVDVVRFLNSKGADINSVDQNNKTPLTLVLENLNKNNVNMAKLLLELGAGCGRVLHFLCDFPLVESELLFTLMAAKQDLLNEQDGEGYTPLHRAVKKNNVLAVQTLLKLGADTNITDNDCLTPLFSMCKIGLDNVEMMTRLIQGGSNIRHKNRFSETPLHEASVYGLVECVKCLLKKGADPNHQAHPNKKTPLHMALKGPSKHSLDIVQLLCENGADITLKDSQMKTAIDVANKMKKYQNVAEYLSRYENKKRVIKQS